MFRNFKKEALTGFLFLLLTSCAAEFLVGCASVDYTDYRQTVLVTSRPAGAEVYNDGEFVGVTPAYVRVRRSIRPRLTFLYPNNPPQDVPLKIHYRWGDSFGTNFLLFTLAPVGWATDLLTGTSWRLDDPPERDFKGRPVPTVNSNTIAIAPPEAIDAESSDAIGQLLERKIQDEKKGRVLPYAETVREFDYFGSDQGLTKNPKRRYNLFYTLKADKILLSRAEPHDDGYYYVNSHMYDVYTGAESDPHTWKLTSEDGSLREQLSQHRYYQQMFHWFPNALYLNLGTYTPQLSIDQQSFRGESANATGFFNQAATYISFLGLGHIDRPRPDVKGHFTFDFVPTLFYSRKKIEFNEYIPLRGALFDRSYVNACYGIEVGHMSWIGFFYFDLVPSLNWSQIRVSSPAVEDTSAEWSTIFVEELGYSRFIGEHLIVKLFVRGISEDDNLWGRAVHAVTRADEVVSNSASSMAGIAFGYYFPSSLNKKKNWKAIDFH